MYTIFTQLRKSYYYLISTIITNSHNQFQPLGQIWVAAAYDKMLLIHLHENLLTLLMAISGTELTIYPKITIVTPSYNQGQFIEDTICSVINQNYPNLEYFIEDGGSTDKTIEIIKKHKENITAWRSSKDGGQADAVNRGWTNATGEILGWLNSDDVYPEGTLKSIAKHWELNKDALMFYGDAASMNKNAEIFYTKSMKNYSINAMLRRKTMPQPSIFITPQLFKSLGLLNTDIHFGLDYDYFFRAWLDYKNHHRYIYINQTLAYSREYAETKSRTGGGEIADEHLAILDNSWSKIPASRKTFMTFFSYSIGIVKIGLVYHNDNAKNRAFNYYKRAIKTNPLVILYLLKRLFFFYIKPKKIKQ